MKYRWDKKYLYWGITLFLVIAASLFFYFGIFHMDSLRGILRTVYVVVTPLVYGAAIAYILNPLVKFFEVTLIFRVLKWRKITITEKIKKVVRVFCVFLTLILFIVSIYGLLAMLIPELISSITNIVENFPRYVDQIQDWLSNLFKNNPELEQLFDTVFDRAEVWMNQELMPQINAVVRNLSSGVYDVMIFLKNFLIGAMISIYMLYGKENFIARGKQFLYSVAKLDRANATIRDLQYVNNMFGGFIIGKIIDSMIIGLLCYIGMSILNLPYTLLISVIIGVTNVIPFFGPYIGAVPSALLILLINPLQCLYFIIFILVLQQFDGNFLGPKILGDTTGLSSFMVIVAIIVGGGFFGIFGMFVGVPVCAIICTIIKNQVVRQLKKKNLPTDVSYYKNIDHLNSETMEPILEHAAKSDTKHVFNYKSKKNVQKEIRETKEDEDQS